MGDQIRRDLLLARLDAALRLRLTLIHAPAGYGKTSLLAQWRQRYAGGAAAIAWLTLERDDADPRHLARYLALALDGATAAAGHGEDGFASGNLPARAALSALINRLTAEARPVVLVLDDFHRADSAAVAEFVGALLRLAPGHCHFVIASRDYPALGQTVLASEGQLLELTAEDLRFSGPETRALFARDHDLAIGEDELHDILVRTEGWPIALQLVFLSLRRGLVPERLLGQLGGSSSELARYLSEQVLMALPADIGEVVVRTALVDRLTGEVVDALCERQDGWALLERLERQGVFLTRHPGGGEAYRYHQLFAEHMRERLARHDRPRFRALQRTAARWFGARGEVAEAVSHAIQADDDELLADLLEDAGAWRLIPRGLQGVAARGLAQLPDALVAARSRLGLARVYLAIKRGELGAARTEYDRLHADAGRRWSAELRSEAQIVGDVLADYENRPIALQDLLAREALLRSLSADDHLLLANIYELLGAKYYEGGWLERALEPTLAAREHYQALGSLYSEIFTRFQEARIRRAQGRLVDSAAILAQARGEIGEAFGERSDLAANCAAFEAEVLYEQDRLDEASALLEWSLPHMEQSDGWVDVYTAAYFTAARIAAARGAMEDALAILARAQRLARRRRLRQLELLAQLCQLQLLVEQGRSDAAAGACARALDLDVLADDMGREAAGYRQVAVAAALDRARLDLAAGEVVRPLRELAGLARWAAEHGAGRVLVEVHLLSACALQQSGDAAAAQARFQDAVGMAMFQRLLRPFVDARRFVEPPLKDALRDAADGGDRFRAQFLKTLARDLACRAPPHAANGLLSEAEIAVLVHLGQGYSNKEIARLIGMSPDTVKYRLKSLFRKTGVHKRRDAVRILRERGLLADDADAARAGP
ncbi:MAG: AAA family ATPase [Pseudoxanthomonas sp.]